MSSDKSVATLEGFLDGIDETLKNPRNIIDVYRKKFILENMGPVHEKLTELINSDTALESRERDLQVKTLWKFAEAAGTLGGEGQQAASITKIYQKNNVIVNPIILRVIEEHTKRLVEGKE